MTWGRGGTTASPPKRVPVGWLEHGRPHSCRVPPRCWRTLHGELHLNNYNPLTSLRVLP